MVVQASTIVLLPYSKSMQANGNIDHQTQNMHLNLLQAAAASIRTDAIRVSYVSPAGSKN